MAAEVQIEANVEQAVPFFSVADIQESVRYYVDGLGFEMTKKWMSDGELRWCWLQNGGAALMLQQFPTQGHDSFKPAGKVGEGVSINFMCRDALKIYHDAIDRGIEAQRPFVGNGLWVVGFADPDGYRIFFESATDVPEGTEYSEHD